MSAHDDRDLPELGWASLGADALPGERDDDALLQDVLAQLDGETEGLRDRVVTPPQPGRSPGAPWGLLALVAVAAAVLLFLVMPRSWLGFESATDVDELAPDVVETKDTELEAERRMHANAPAPRSDAQQAVVHEPPRRQPPSEPAGAKLTPTDSVARSKPRTGPPRPSSPPTSSPSADDMLRTAQDTLARGDRGAALVAYQALVEAHPRSGEARAAWVSIGRIHLRAGRAKPALKAFDTYLATPRGALRQEARYGRLQAFEKQDSRATERGEIEAFMRDFPRSLYAARLQTRLEALQ